MDTSGLTANTLTEALELYPANHSLQWESNWEIKGTLTHQLLSFLSNTRSSSNTNEFIRINQQLDASINNALSFLSKSDSALSIHSLPLRLSILSLLTQATNYFSEESNEPKQTTPPSTPDTPDKTSSTDVQHLTTLHSHLFHVRRQSILSHSPSHPLLLNFAQSIQPSLDSLVSKLIKTRSLTYSKSPAPLQKSNSLSHRPISESAIRPLSRSSIPSSPSPTPRPFSHSYSAYNSPSPYHPQNFAPPPRPPGYAPRSIQLHNFASDMDNQWSAFRTQLDTISTRLQAIETTALRLSIPSLTQPSSQAMQVANLESDSAALWNYVQSSRSQLLNLLSIYDDIRLSVSRVVRPTQHSHTLPTSYRARPSSVTSSPTPSIRNSSPTIWVESTDHSEQDSSTPASILFGNLDSLPEETEITDASPFSCGEDSSNSVEEESEQVFESFGNNPRVRRTNPEGLSREERIQRIKQQRKSMAIYSPSPDSHKPHSDLGPIKETEMPTSDPHHILETLPRLAYPNSFSPNTNVGSFSTLSAPTTSNLPSNKHKSIDPNMVAELKDVLGLLKGRKRVSTVLN